MEGPICLLYSWLSECSDLPKLESHKVLLRPDQARGAKRTGKEGGGKGGLNLGGAWPDEKSCSGELGVPDSQ